MADRTYVFRLTGDFSQLEAASAAAGGAVDGLTGKTEGFAQAQGRADKAADKTAKTMRGFAATGKLTAQELTQVGFQVNDFAVQVASGQSALIAAIQQGSQLTGTFGGIGNAARALASLLTPVRLVVGGLAAGFGTVALAAVQGYREQAQLERSLLLTGNRAGITGQQFEQLARKIEQSTSATISASKQALQAVVATGQFGPQEIEAVTRAVVLYAERSGQSAEDVAKDFARMGDSASRFALERNKSLNFLTAAQLKYIRQLEAEGRAEEARIEVSRLLSEQLGKKTPTELGFLETALKTTAKVASDFWASLLNIGKPTSLDEQVDRALADLERLQQGLGASPEDQGQASGRAIAAANERLAALRAARDKERGDADRAAADAKKNQREIYESGREFVDSSIAVQRAGYARSAAAREVALARERSALEQQFEQNEVSQQRYVERRYAIEKAAIDLKAQQIDQEAALEKRRVVENPAERNAAAARLVEIEARRVALAKDYLDLDDRRRRGELAGRPREVREDASTSFRQAELQQTQAVSEAVNASLRERRDASRSVALDIAAANQGLSLSLIRDDRARGEAQIAIEEATLRKRLDLAILNAEERAAAEDALARFVVLRNQQLTEELKPEWQRLLEGWQDTNKLLKDTTDRFQADFLRTSEDVFVKFVRDRKLDVKSLLDLILETEARLVYQRNFGQSVGGLGGFIAGLFAPSVGAGSNPSGFNGTLNNPSAYVPPQLATGTNRVPSDGLYFLHKNEAVQPAEYNPAVGGGGASPQVTVNLYGAPAGTQVEQRQDANGNLSIDVLYSQFVSRLNSDTASGYGVAPGIQRRFGGSGAANLGR